MLIFLKLGGSLITDKRREEAFLADRMARLASAIHEAWRSNPTQRLLLGHGSGSFGHFAARRHGTMDGVQTPAQWRGFAEVARTAARLNRLVADSLGEAGLPVWPIQPSASAMCADGELGHLDTEPLKMALENGLVPLVHGDVALDSVRGGTIISTEAIFAYLAPVLRPQHIFLVGEVEGVLDRAGNVIRAITPENWGKVGTTLGGSHGVDVTGGMASKVREMIHLAQRFPKLTVHILSGLEPEIVRDALLAPDSAPGTAISGQT